MNKYPVEIPYSFTVDLNIKEQHIPFVQVSILTDNIEEETIEFAPDTKSFNYRDTFYVYGKKIEESEATLLYFGDPIKRVIRYSANYPQFLGGWIREKWRAKYLVPNEWGEGNYYFVNWYEVEDVTDTDPRLGWVRNFGDPSNKYWLKCPPIGTYSEIIVKRNTGLATVIASGSMATIFGNVLTHVATPPSFANVTDGQFLRIISGTDVTSGYYKIISHTDDTVTLDGNPGNNDIGDVVYDISDSYSIAQGVNPDYDVPDYYTFPNLTRCEYQFSNNGYAGETSTLYANFEASNVPHHYYSSNNPTRDPTVPRPTENINMSKMWLQVGLGRYRLKVYGKFYKWTNKQVKSVQTYPIGTYTFVRGEAGEDDYIFSSKVESTGTLNLYEPEPNPCNVRLLVSYLNNSGQNEIREYSL